jgi:cell division initiation protein
MKIGPVDLRNLAFTKRVRGVDEDEVRDYLEMVANRLEETLIEGEELRTRIDRLEAELAEFRQLERSMRDSLLSAERLVDDRTAQAEKEAQIVIKNAELQADKLVLRAREDLGRLHAEVDDLRRQRVTYVERFRALLRSQTRILEASLETLDPESTQAPSRTPSPSSASVPAPYAAPPPPPPSGGPRIQDASESSLFAPERLPGTGSRD